MVVFCVAVLWIYDIRLALVSTAFVPLLAASVMVHHRPIKSKVPRSHGARRSTVRPPGRRHFRRRHDQSLWPGRPVDQKKANRRLWRVVQSGFSLQKLGISMSTAGVFVTGIAGVVILWYGGHRVMVGALTIGELMFFYTLLGYVLQPLERLTSVNLQLQEALVAIDRLYQVMDLDTEQPERPDQGGIRRTDSRHSSGRRQLPLRLPTRRAEEDQPGDSGRQDGRHRGRERLG